MRCYRPRTWIPSGSLKRQGLKIGLVSNVTLLPEMMREDMETLGLLDAFRRDGVLVRREGAQAAPAHLPGRTRCGSTCLAPRLIFVGDRLKEDIRGPKEAGMRAVLTTQFRQEDPADAAVQPDAVIAHACRALPAAIRPWL